MQRAAGGPVCPACPASVATLSSVVVAHFSGGLVGQDVEDLGVQSLGSAKRDFRALMYSL